jgi:hypothetical protein
LYSNVGEELIALSNKYSLGLSSELQSEFTFDVYSNLSTLLADSDDGNNVSHTNFLDIISKSLKGLYKSVLNDREQMLTIQKLQSTIEEMTNKMKSYSILDVQSSLKSVATIRPEVNEYIKQYGLPAGLVFDPILLGELINKLDA